MSLEILQICDVSFSYPEVDVLYNIEFSVRKGDFIGIIGPNGSGKSTLLRCMTNTLPVQGGDILLLGKPVDRYSRLELAKKVAVVPQSTEVAFNFSCEDIVLMGRAPYISRFGRESKKDYEIVRNVMDLTNTSHLAKRNITSLSGGERQRVIVAQALAQEPEVLLLDEPTSHLDISHQVEILDLVSSLSKREGLTVVTVMHDLNLSAMYSDYLVMLKDGTVYVKGKAKEVITPKNIKEVYGARVCVTAHPETGKPHVILNANSNGSEDGSPVALMQ